MTVSIPPELLEAAAKEQARKEAWFRVPGIEIGKEGLNGEPSDILSAINSDGYKVNIKVAAVIDYWGDSNFVIVTTNALSPRQFFLAMSEDDFTKEFFA